MKPQHVLKHMQYKPNFPSNFPSSGVWEITYFDLYKEGHPLVTSNVFVAEHMGQYKLLRNRSKYGWDYRTGEDNKCLMLYEVSYDDSPYYVGQWKFYTWQSVIHLVRARLIADSVFD